MPKRCVFIYTCALSSFFQEILRGAQDDIFVNYWTYAVEFAIFCNFLSLAYGVNLILLASRA